MISISQRNGTGVLAAFVGAIVLIIFAGRVGTSIGGSGSGVYYLVLFLLGVLSAALPLIYTRSKWPVALAIFAGIPFGVFIDVWWDWTVNRVDRNLFPIEIVFWWGGSVIPVFLGYLIGYIIRLERNRELSRKP